MSLAPRIAVHGFETRLTPDPKDPNVIREIDWVTYGPLGQGDRSKNTDRVSRLRCVQKGDMTNPAIRDAAIRWSIIEPLYTAWKAGREAPVDGTPLAVLNSIGLEQADFLRARGVKTVEDLAALTDTNIQQLKLSGLRNYIAEARRWLEASDSRKVVAMIAEKDREIVNQQAQLSEQQEQIQAMMRQMEEFSRAMTAQAEAKATETDEPAKRGPGRPRKEAEAA